MSDIKQIARQAARQQFDKADTFNEFDSIADAVAVAVLQYLHGESEVLGPRRFDHFDVYLAQFAQLSEVHQEDGQA